MATKKGVKYTFEGQYYTASDTPAAQIKDYKLDVVFPEETPKALSLFVTALSKQSPMLAIMKTHYPDFTALRTHVITNVENLNSNATGGKSGGINTMNTNQLKKYIKDHKLPIDPDVYEGEIVKLRHIITLAETDTKSFEAEYRADVEEWEFNKEIQNLNDDANVDDNQEKEPSAVVNADSLGLDDDTKGTDESDEQDD